MFLFPLISFGGVPLIYTKMKKICRVINIHCPSYRLIFLYSIMNVHFLQSLGAFFLFIFPQKSFQQVINFVSPTMYFFLLKGGKEIK